MLLLGSYKSLELFSYLHFKTYLISFLITPITFIFYLITPIKQMIVFFRTSWGKVQFGEKYLPHDIL